MQPVTVIVAALGAGAAAGLGGDSAATAVNDAYTRLKTLVAARLAGNDTAEVALARHANDPHAWEAPLAEALLDRNAGGDSELLAAARRVLNLLAEGRATTYEVTVNESKGVQIGDHGRQVNHFGR